MTQAIFKYTRPDNADFWYERIESPLGVVYWYPDSKPLDEIGMGNDIVFLPADFPCEIIAVEFLAQHPTHFDKWFLANPTFHACVIESQRIEYSRDSDDYFNFIDKNSVAQRKLVGGGTWFNFKLLFYPETEYVEVVGERYIPESWHVIQDSTLGRGLTEIYELHPSQRKQLVTDTLQQVWGNVANLEKAVEIWLDIWSDEF